MVQGRSCLLIALSAVVFVAAFVGFIGVGVWRAIRAEENHHATLLTIRVVDQFIHEKHRWPTSWTELEEVSFPSPAPSPLNVRWDGSRAMYNWPRDCHAVHERVEIDFDFDVYSSGNLSRGEFCAIMPSERYCYEYRDSVELHYLLRSIEEVREK